MVAQNRSDIDVVRGSIMSILGFGRRDVGNGLEQAARVETVALLKGSVFYRFEGLPSSMMNGIASAL